MPEDEKPKTLEEMMQESYSKDAEEKKAKQQLHLDTVAWMKTDPKVQQWLNQFSPVTIDSFITSYAAAKSLFMTFGESHAAIKEQQLEEHVLQAQERILDIQKKKLFDIICQWNANLLQLPEIACTWDFFYWEKQIMECPFLTPISGDEFDLYLKFARSKDFNHEAEIAVSDFELYKEMDDDEVVNLPEWFVFENLHTGNNKYLILPNTRTEKENFYRSLWRKEEDEKIEQKYESGEFPRPEQNAKPMLKGHNYRFLERFIKQYESKDVYEKFYKYYESNPDQLVRDNAEDNEDGYLTERANEIVIMLHDVKEKIPVKANKDWRQALINAYETYNRNHVVEALTYVYSDYQNRIANGLGFQWQDTQNNYMKELAENVRNQILRGRELNGEPRDFNF
ncbi:hypothetical protein BH11BAC6_BH11BAC6_12150 [soil metagenome]